VRKGREMPPLEYYMQPEKDRELKRFERNGNNYRITFTQDGIKEHVSRFNLLHTNDAGETFVGIFWKPGLEHKYEAFSHITHKENQFYEAGFSKAVLNWLLDNYEEWLEEQHNLAYQDQPRP
jgi:hypothetical protein